ncbi:hypothetical protein OBJ95_12965 [Empedobacter falsenii]
MKQYFYYTIIIFLFLLSRLIFLEFNFWGLEYEDSYIYYDNAINIKNDIIYPENLLQCVSCELGSYQDCTSYYTYGAHYKVFSYVIYYFNLIFKLGYNGVFILNTILSLFILLSYFLFDTNYNRRIIFTLLMAITPFYPLYTTTGNSEIFSSLFVFISFILVNQYISKKQIYFLILSILSAIIASISNRENFILFPLIALAILFFTNYSIINKILKIGLTTLTSILVFLFMNVINDEKEYSDQIQSKTFSISYLIDNTRALVEAILSLELWGLTGFLFILIIIFSLIKLRDKKYVQLLSMFIIGYYLITFTHYRHQHYLITGQLYDYETLRYTTTFLPLIFLFIVFGISKFKISKRSFVIILIIFSSFSCYKTLETRISFSRDENYSRVIPSKKLIEYYKKNDLLVSNFPILLRIYSSENTNIADLNSIENIDLNNYNNIYLLLDKYEYNNLKPKFKLKKIESIFDKDIYILKK